MKSPLMYQMTETTTGDIAVYNCISYLFDREEMPSEFLNIMASYSVGCYDEDGNLSNKDFYDNFLFFASSWIADYAKEKHIPLSSRYLSGDDVNLLTIRNCLLAGGCVDLKTTRRGRHYISITRMDDEYMYIFDPYFKPEGAYKPQNGIEVVLDRPFEYNRKVKIEKFIQENKSELNLGVKSEREAVFFYNNRAVLQREFV